MQVQEMMTTEIHTVGCNDDLRLVYDIMEAGHIRHVPVMEGASVVGIVSQRDVFRAQMSSTIGVGERGQRHFLHSILVNDIMSSPVTTIGPKTPVSKAAAMMINHGIGCLPVVNEGDLVGFITKTDLLQHLRNTGRDSEELHDS